MLGQAAHIEGKGFGSIDMTGLAQKGGAVACHMRVAKNADEIHAIRVGVANADLIMGGDLVVTASSKILETMKPDHTAVVVSTYEMTTGDFTRNPNLTVPGQALRTAIADRAGKAPVSMLDAHEAAVKLFGDSIASNMYLLGFAFQKGFVPIGAAAIEEAITLNGAAVPMNLQAFRFGRLAAHDAAAIERLIKPVEVVQLKPRTLDDAIEFRAKHLTAYQDDKLAERYRSKVAWIAGLEKDKTPGRIGPHRCGRPRLPQAARDQGRVRGCPALHRRHIREAAERAVRRREVDRIPPRAAVARVVPPRTSSPASRARSSWDSGCCRCSVSLPRASGWRGTMLDVFGMSAERRLERQMIADYETVLDEIGHRLSPATHSTAVALASLPLEIKGFGHVKRANYDAAKKREEGLLAMLRDPKPASPVRVAAE